MKTDEKWAAGFGAATIFAKKWLAENLDFGSPAYREQFVRDFEENMYCFREAMKEGRL